MRLHSVLQPRIFTTSGPLEPVSQLFGQVTFSKIRSSRLTTRLPRSHLKVALDLG